MAWIDLAEKKNRHSSRQAGFWVGRMGGLLDVPSDIPPYYRKDWEDGWMAGVMQIPKEGPIDG
jgi:hypothetical protein